jgi:hypothetical protein
MVSDPIGREMHLSKLFLVSVYVYTGIANAMILEKRVACDFASPKASCKDAAGVCVATPTCHFHVFWTTCYCSVGTAYCEGC